MTGELIETHAEVPGSFSWQNPWTGMWRVIRCILCAYRVFLCTMSNTQI